MYCGIFMLLWDIFQLHHNHKNIHFSFENVLKILTEADRNRAVSF